MRIITRLIAIEWIKSFIGAFLVLILLTTAADILSGFLRAKSAEYVFTFFIIKFPEFLSKIIPASCLLATLFSLNNLKAHSELIAILATGFSTKKIISIIASLAIIVSFIQFIIVSFFMPLSNKLKLDYESELQTSKLKKAGLQTSSLDNGKVWYKSKTYFASFTVFDRKNNELRDLSLYFFSPNFKGSKIITAETAKYVEDKVWTIKNGISYSKLENEQFPKPIRFDEISLNLNEVPDDFKKFESEVKTLNLFSLSRFISRMEQTGISVKEYKVLFYEKIALSVVCIIFALISLPALYSPNRRSSSFAKSIIFTLMFSLGFWLLHTSAIALGISGSIPAFWASTLIPLLFTLIIAATFYKHRKL